jgi:hypothetical protein
VETNKNTSITINTSISEMMMIAGAVFRRRG